MTLDQTRKLGIEFERRLQTINENMKISDKIDTDDIYSYLNQYQEYEVNSLREFDNLSFYQIFLQYYWHYIQ